MNGGLYDEITMPTNSGIKSENGYLVAESEKRSELNQEFVGELGKRCVHSQALCNLTELEQQE